MLLPFSFFQFCSPFPKSASANYFGVGGVTTSAYFLCDSETKIPVVPLALIRADNAAAGEYYCLTYIYVCMYIYVWSLVAEWLERAGGLGFESRPSWAQKPLQA